MPAMTIYILMEKRSHYIGDYTVRAFFMRGYGKKICEYLLLWLVGGCLYFSFEVMFRGFSHWSMFVLGGICMCFCAWQGSVREWRDPLWVQLLRCMVFITSCEFITGIIVNKWMDWHVWDYTGMPLQLFGQICVPFMLLFGALAGLGIYLGGNILWKFFGEKKPHFFLI